MKRLWLVVALGLSAATQAGGCHHDDDDQPAPPEAVQSEGSELTYPNGHPLCTPTSDPAVLSVEDELGALTNNYRVSNGFSALTHDVRMREVARAHSKHMTVHDPSFFAHTNPEGDGPGARLSACGVAWWSAGENIAGGYPTAASAFNAWLNSPGHLANIRNAGWTHMGMGYGFGGGTYFRYYTQVFAVPQ